MSEIIQKDPYTLCRTARCHYHFDVLKDKITLAKETQKSWCQKTIAERKSILLHALGYFRKHEKLICRQIFEEMGKPLPKSTMKCGAFLKERTTSWRLLKVL